MFRGTLIPSVVLAPDVFKLLTLLTPVFTCRSSAPPPSQAFSPQLPRWAGGCGDGLDLALSSLSVCLSVLSLSVLGSVFLWSPHSLRLRETSWRAEGLGKGRSGKTLTRAPLPMLPLPRIHGTRRTSGCGTTCSQSSPACLSRAQRRASPASSTPATPSCSSPP